MITENEKWALEVADNYKGNISTEAKIKWLAGEVVELAAAYQEGDKEHIQEEIGDCLYLLSHILSRYSNKGVIEAIIKAANKLVQRNKDSTPRGPTGNLRMPKVIPITEGTPAFQLMKMIEVWNKLEHTPTKAGDPFVINLKQMAKAFFKTHPQFQIPKDLGISKVYDNGVGSLFDLC